MQGWKTRLGETAERRGFVRYEANGFARHPRYRGVAGCWIYLLVDPRDDTVRYVGVTDDPDRRFEEHLRAEHGNVRLRNWILELRSAGVAPYMPLIDRKRGMKWAPAEQKWILYFRKRGDLYNIHKGGVFKTREELTKIAAREHPKKKKRRRRGSKKKPTPAPFAGSAYVPRSKGPRTVTRKSGARTLREVPVYRVR